MALTPSKMLPLGTSAPDFTLVDAITSEELSLRELKTSHGVVVMFICNHCPYVKHIQETLVAVAREYESKGISFIAINANDIEAYPDDAPDQMKMVAQKFQYPFPYLFDETQQVARAYQAACTPDFYLFNAQLKLVYRGQFDGSRPQSGVPVTGADLKTAMDSLIAGSPISAEQRPSLGCNIKWKSKIHEKSP